MNTASSVRACASRASKFAVGAVPIDLLSVKGPIFWTRRRASASAMMQRRPHVPSSASLTGRAVPCAVNRLCCGACPAIGVGNVRASQGAVDVSLPRSSRLKRAGDYRRCRHDAGRDGAGAGPGRPRAGAQRTAPAQTDTPPAPAPDAGRPSPQPAAPEPPPLQDDVVEEVWPMPVEDFLAGKYLERADVVLTRREWDISSWAIRWATNSPFSHAAMVFTGPQFESGYTSTFVIEVRHQRRRPHQPARLHRRQERLHRHQALQAAVVRRGQAKPRARAAARQDQGEL